MKRKIIVHFFILFSLVVPSVPAFAFHTQGGYCDLLFVDLTVCAENKAEFLRKSEALSGILLRSLERKTMLPEKVTEAGKAVFQFFVQYEYHEIGSSEVGYLEAGYSEAGYSEAGSGFFLFNKNTLVTNQHVLEFILNDMDISNWNKIVFRDQEGETKDFSVKGVKFVSKLHDLAVLEVEGYEGPVLDLAAHSPQEQSYFMGYSADSATEPSKLKIQSVQNAFDITDILYGAFIELLDCYYGFSFSGSSGGPMVNRQGKVEAVSSNMVDSTGCPFLMARKVNFLYEKLNKDVKTSHSVQEAKVIIKADKENTIELARSGNKEAQLELRYRLDTIEDVDLKNKILDLDHILTRHLKVSQGGLDYLVYNGMNSEDLLHSTWYAAGNYAYQEEDIKTACEFWEKAGQMGHPYVHPPYVIFPDSRENVIYCGDYITTEIDT